MLGFLLVDEADFAVDPDDAAKRAGPETRPAVLAGGRRRRSPTLGDWATATIEAALRAVAGRRASGSSPRSRSAPVRVAVTGRRVSPPLFESIELLGRDRTLARLRAAAATVAG